MEHGGGPALVSVSVDASEDVDLLVAAEALASALDAEGIAAMVNQNTDTNTDVIHIRVGSKPNPPARSAA
jgi:hypothetical protein